MYRITGLPCRANYEYVHNTAFGICLRAMEVVPTYPTFLDKDYLCMLDGASLAKIDSQDKQDIVETYMSKY